MEYELTLAKGHTPIKPPSHSLSATVQEEKAGWENSSVKKKTEESLNNCYHG